MSDSRMCMTARDISAEMGLSLPIVYQLMKRQDFPLITIGRRCVVPRESFKAWLEKSAAEHL